MPTAGVEQNQVPLGKMASNYISLTTKTPSQYKQDYHDSTITVREGYRHPSEMTRLWDYGRMREGERARDRKKKKKVCVCVCVSGGGQ